MEKLLPIFLTLFITGCATPQFVVNEADNRFSENKNALFLSENNRISSKSIAGGIHIDNTGVFLNPFVEKDKDTGESVILGLTVVNKTDYDTTYGGVNQLGIIKEVIFRFTDGSILSLDAKNQENRTSDTISYNSVAKYASYDKWETATLLLTTKEFKKLATATSVSCKIFGSKQNVVYEEADISKTFLSNLNSFYTTHIK